jgi:hypothetical protein
VNPTVKNNTTGEFVKINREIDATQILIISTEFGKKKVEIKAADGAITNAFNYIDLDSTFFQLQPGNNEIEYLTNNSDKASKVIIRYQNRYVGV